MLVGALVGPTASGKSALALAVAQRSPDVELVSLDALQVYRGMDIGTAKPGPAERAAVRHHLIDLIEPHEQMSVARFQEAFRAALDDIAARGRRALVVGGTGLYLRACLDDLEIPGQFPDVAARLAAEPDTPALHARLADADPAAAARMEPTNRRRILRALEVTEGSGRPFSSYGPGLDAYPEPSASLVGLRMARPDLDARIEARITHQLDAGWLDEVRALRARPAGWSRTAAQALGYRELADHLAGTCTLDEAVAAIVARTRRFARRQERWFRRDPRIGWVAVDVEPLDHLDEVLAVLEGLPASGRPAGP